MGGAREPLGLAVARAGVAEPRTVLAGVPEALLGGLAVLLGARAVAVGASREGERVAVAAPVKKALRLPVRLGWEVVEGRGEAGAEGVVVSTEEAVEPAA